MQIDSTLQSLAESGNMRHIPSELDGDVVDFSSNDYLGLAGDVDLRRQFLSDTPAERLLMTSSASRLLAAPQRDYNELESLLADCYGSAALLFNSGYHANVGLVSALASGGDTLVVADRLVHASIIDGIKLAGCPFERFRHNDYDHLERILAAKASRYPQVLIIAESVYSMDGDFADVARLAHIKRGVPNAMLYIDEAHAVGVVGPGGLGLSAREGVLADVDILVGTLGKALASSGAFAILRGRLREFMVNKARSLIFSTALPPACARWSIYTWRRSLQADDLRAHLAILARHLAAAIPGGAPSHIRPLVIGDPIKAVAMSAKLLEAGFKVLPIRTPTVPPGTERLRFSLSAAIAVDDVDRLATCINQCKSHEL